MVPKPAGAIFGSKRLPDRAATNEERADWNRRTKDIECFLSVQADLVRKLPHSWVGVYREQVVATADNLQTLRSQLENLNITATDVLIEYLFDEEEARSMVFAVR